MHIVIIIDSGERLHNFAIDVSSDMRTNVDDPDTSRCALYPGTATNGVVIQITCTTPTRGRWVKIQIRDTNSILGLCEVEVYGSKEFLSGKLC
jgi:hypothetical protein